MFGAPRSTQCQDCKVVFTKDYYLKAHICGITTPSVNWTVKGKDKEQCPKCGMSFHTHMQLAKHYASQHTNEKKFECDKCDKKFHARKNLLTHKSCAHSDPVTCEKCGKVLKSKNRYLIHIKRFHGDKNYKNFKSCKICRERFSTYSSIRKHSFEAHNVEIPWPYPCTECDRGFERKPLLTKHLSKVHNIEV